MNKRIKELADQAGVSIMGANENGVFTLLSDKQKKFAELIVQEMLGVLEQYHRDSFPEDTVDDFDKAYLAGLHTAQKAVKKHFGVDT